MVDSSIAYKCASGVLPKMMDCDFWIKKDETADNVRMDIAQVELFNRTNVEKLALATYLYDLAGFSDAFGYGVCVRRGVMWAAPEEKDALTAIYVNEPVVILKMYNEWIKIRCVYYEGWIRRHHIAMFHSYDEWEKHYCMKDFILITGDYITIPYVEDMVKAARILVLPRPQMDDSDRSYIGLRLDMGVRLELDMTYWNSVSEGRYYNYAVKVPVKQSDGYVDFVTVAIPISKDVHMGYLPYTGANVLRQAYKMLGNVYGWGGKLCGRDCSALIMDVHRCFGFIMPRDVSGQMRMAGCRTLRFEDIDDWNYLRAGDIVGWKTVDSSHTFIYLGFDGEHYGLSAVGGLYSSCIINSVEQLRDSGISWKESVSYGKLLRN